MQIKDKMKIIVKGPILTQSGYGEHARFLMRSLKKYEDVVELYLLPLNWGNTNWLAESTAEREWWDKLIGKTQAYLNSGNKHFDMSIQVTIPNEWEQIATVNVGVTAGIETNRIAPEWIGKAHLMNRIIVPSEHAKNVFESTTYEAKNEKTGEIDKNYRCQTPITVVPYPAKPVEPKDIELDLDYDFNFLTIAQWGPRKNLENTIRWFMEAFNDKEVGLVVKTSLAKNCTIDRRVCETKLNSITKDYPDRKCKVYMLHGYMTDTEMSGLYNHSKIKSYITATHGEGYGLPIFEAAYYGVPIIAPAWSGHVDFLFQEVKDKKGKKRIKPMFSKVEFRIKPIKEEAVWETVIPKESMWCFVEEKSFKVRMQDMHENYSVYKKRAKDLKKMVLKKYEENSVNDLFAKSVFGGEITTEKPEAEYIFVSDLFVEDYSGGAEMTFENLMKECPGKFGKVHSSKLTPALLGEYKDAKWIFGNITQLNPAVMVDLGQKDINYSFVEFDYKYCKHRNPVLYEFVEGEPCNYMSTDVGGLIVNFLINAKSVFFMSEAQKDLYFEHLPTAAYSTAHVLSSVFDSKFYDKINELNKKYEGKKNDKWIVLNSGSWVKGVDQSRTWCEQNNVEYEIIGGLAYDEFLEKLAESKGICFKPTGLDTCPRYVIEAKLLGCELELNENVQHLAEDWFDGDTPTTVEYLKSRVQYFWKNAFE